MNRPTSSESTIGRVAMREGSVRSLCCPLCRGSLRWEVQDRTSTEILGAVVDCPSCGTRSEVRGGVGYFLPGDARFAIGTAPRVEPPQPANRSEIASAELPAPWARAFQRAVAKAGDALPEGRAPTLQLAGDRSASMIPPGGGFLIASSVGELRSPALDPREPAQWDELVVELHSLPFVNDAAENAFAGPSLQGAPGLRVILRELHRVVRDRLVAVVAFPSGEDAGTRFDPNYSEAGLLGEFRRARWEPRFDLVEVAEGPGSLDVPSPGTPPVPWHWGVVVAE